MKHREKPPPDPAVAVRCRCTQRIVLEARWIGKPQACARCQSDFVVTFVVDRRTRRRVPHVRYLPAKPAATVPEVETVTCACGTEMRIDDSLLGHTLGCTACPRHLIVRKEGGVLMVEVAEPPPKKAQPFSAAKATHLKAGKRPPPPPEMKVLCVCAEELVVPAMFYNKNMYCAACGALMHLRLGFDAKSGQYELQGTILSSSE